MKLPRETEKKQRKELYQALSFMSRLSTTMIACVALGVFLGKVLDNALGTSPWLLLVFSLLGMASALKAIYDMGMNKK